MKSILLLRGQVRRTWNSQRRNLLTSSREEAQVARVQSGDPAIYRTHGEESVESALVLAGAVRIQVVNQGILHYLPKEGRVLQGWHAAPDDDPDRDRGHCQQQSMHPQTAEIPEHPERGQAAGVDEGEGPVEQCIVPCQDFQDAVLHVRETQDKVHEAMSLCLLRSLFTGPFWLLISVRPARVCVIFRSISADTRPYSSGSVFHNSVH